MKSFRVKDMILDFNVELTTLSPESAGIIIIFEDIPIILTRYVLRGSNYVWYYRYLHEAQEHYTSRLATDTRVYKLTFVRGRPLARVGSYSGPVHRAVLRNFGHLNRPDPLIDRAFVLENRSLLADATERAFVASLVEFDYEGPLVNNDAFLQVKATLNAKECRICGRLHVMEGEFCNVCADLVTEYMDRVTDGTLVPKAFIARLADGSTIPLWNAVGKQLRCQDCGKTYTYTRGGQLLCPECAAKVRNCCLCGQRIRFLSENISVEGVGHFHVACAKKPLEKGYHSNTSHSSPTFFGEPAREDFPLFMGIELEGAGKHTNVGAQKPSMAEKIVKTKLGDLMVEATRDGSLPGGGIEIISQPMTIEKWRETMPRWKEALALLPKYASIYGHDARCAGLHVHVSKEAFQRYTPIADDPEYRNKVVFGRLVVMFARFQDEFLFISRRNKDRKAEYAKTLVSHDDLAAMPEDRFRVEFARLRERALSSSGHYTELNISPKHTLEFRLFRSTFNAETLMATLEFVHGLCWFVSNNGMERCRTISFDDLIAAIDSPVLTAYVARVVARRSRTQDDGFEGEE